jgi:hypothetical protein
MRMSSIHTWKAREKASRLGGYAGAPDAAHLWDLSKRELIEIALRLGQQCAENDSMEAAIKRVNEEFLALETNGII